MPEENSPNPAKEHPLVNIFVNVLIPVLALSHLSKDPTMADAKAWHIGPLYALFAALALPLAYGIWFFIKTRKMNFFSALGLFSVVLTGGLTLFLWNEDGTVKEQAALLFGLKEASIPFVLGFAVVASHWSKTPLLRTFLYSDNIFNIPKIENRISELGKETDYQKVILNATLLFAMSFFVSTLLNFGTAMYFLGDLDHTAHNAREIYNEKVAKVTGAGFLIIGLPIMAFLYFTLKKLFSGLRELTGFKDEELMMPR